MKLHTPEGSELINIESVKNENGKLVIRGLIMGAMPMVAIVSPQEARKGLKLISLKLFFWLIFFMFRR